MIKKLLSTTGDVSVKLAKNLFESKIEPTLPYRSIIWATEKSTNTVLVTGTKITNQENARNSFLTFQRIVGRILPKVRTGKEDR